MSRTLDIPLDEAETVSIELNALMDDPNDYIELLKEGNSNAGIWTRLACEYWRIGNRSATNAICSAAIEYLTRTRRESTLSPVYAMLANIRVADAQRAPKVVMPDARFDVLQQDTKTKAAFVDEANGSFNRVVSQALNEELYFMTRGILLLASRKTDEARRTFDQILTRRPNNIVALMGRARVLYQRREYGPALKAFQRVLQLAPNSLPDPRIGIGLCLWALGAKDKARAAWERSIEVHPGNTPATVLLGLAKLNFSKDVGLEDAERAQEYHAGIKYIEQVWKADKTSAAAANALADMFLRKGDLRTSLKLAERTIQYADTLSLLADGHLRAGRTLHIEGDRHVEAAKHYETVNKNVPGVLASVGLAGIYLQKEDPAAAIHVLETILAPGGLTGQSSKDGPAAPRIEAMIMLGSLQAHSRPGVSSTDFSKGRARARDLFDRAMRELETARADLAKRAGIVSGEGLPVRALGEEVALHVEIARLWSEDPSAAGLGSMSSEKASRALSEALRIARAAGATQDAIYARLLNNAGVLKHGEEAFADALAAYQEALGIAMDLDPEVGEPLQVTALYNMGRASEDSGDLTTAGESYAKLVARHPEYVDAKIRQAHLLVGQNRINEAHDLVRQAIASTPHALNIRAYQTHFLVRVGLWRAARDIVFTTMRDMDKNDIYHLCAAGIIHYQQARDLGRGFGNSTEWQEGAMPPEARRKNFLRAAELFDKALSLDPYCAVAAQGLAIIVAEDALGTLGGTLSSAPAPSAAGDMAKYAREALEIFSKLRESVGDGSVYLNMGHCYHTREEFERAIESYETANKRFFEGRSVNVLLCLARTWYSKAVKDSSYPAMRSALKYMQQALHLTPGDKATLYNIAMIQQKAGEMMFGLDPSRRTMVELRRAIDMADRAQALFSALASDPAPQLPYSKDIAEQRRRYGDGLLRKKEEHIAAQEAHERELASKMDAARQRRQDEKDRAEAAERERVEQLKRQAELLAEERRKARAELDELHSKMKEESDDEKRSKEQKKQKRQQAKVAAALGSGDEGDGAAPVETGKKRKRRVVRKRDTSPKDDEPEAMATDDDGEALFSGGDDEPKEEQTTTKRISKKRVIKDDDDDGQSAEEAPRRKKIKSREEIEDSDIEM